MRLGYTVSLSRSLTLGRDILYTTRLEAYVILVLGGLLLVIFATAICILDRKSVV